MQHDDLRRRSRWLMRAMEWDDTRARYPNLWHEGMPRHVLAFDRVACRLRLGDLVGVFYPVSQVHPERSGKYLGLSRVVGLRRAEDPAYAWIDLETAHRFDPPLVLDRSPRRVFLCCDAGWPEAEVALFRRLFEAAVAGGFVPDEEDLEPEAEAGATVEAAARAVGAGAGRSEAAEAGGAGGEVAETPAPTAAETGSAGPEFAGVDYSGDMRDPRHATWLAVVELRGKRVRVTRLEATGRHGLQAYLRDPDRTLMGVEAIGLGFPFGLPLPFAESLLGGPFPDEGWWALAKKLEKLTRPDYLIALQGYREAHGEPKRFTDEKAGAFSPLHRVNPDLGPMTYHGIRMIAEDRSRYAVKPFESAQGKPLLEVYPGGLTRHLVGAGRDPSTTRVAAILRALGELPRFAVDVEEPLLRNCLSSRDALDAVIAARQAAVAVVSGEVERSPDDLAPGEGARVRVEGWIYGLEEPGSA